MGPLVSTGVIGSEWAIVIAFGLGIAFGYILESAGFSTSRKLVGVFYGYDFTVLRVFFTAAIVGVTGLLLLSYFELIDLDLIWVNRLNTKSTILGGVLMGIGFIIGGFCPGTSICAIGIGKLDALAFFGGIILGIWFFAEFYPIFEPVHAGTPGGKSMIYDVLGMSRGLFVLILIVVAIAAFYVTALIEKKAKKVEY